MTEIILICENGGGDCSPDCNCQCDSCIAVRYIDDLEEKLVASENVIRRLGGSLGLCHYYAGCTSDNCKLDGDMCTGQSVVPHT